MNHDAMHEPLDNADIPEPRGVIPVPLRAAELLHERRQLLTELERIQALVREVGAAHKAELDRLRGALERVDDARRVAEQSHRRTAAALTVALNALQSLVAACDRVSAGKVPVAWSEPDLTAVSQARELLLTAGRDVK